jgi:hypothetical protein
MSLDADALLDGPTNRRGRLLAPLLVAAVVVGVAVAVAVATRSVDRTSSVPSTGHPVRPAWSYVHGHVTAVNVTIVRKSSVRSRYGAPTVRRTVTGPDAQQLATILNKQPAQRPYAGLCPGLPLRANDSLLFHTDTQVLRVSMQLGCTVLATITGPGRKGEYVYISGAELDRDTVGALGLPSKYGLGLRSGSSATASRVGFAPMTTRTSAETIARHAINAHDSAPTFSRLISVAGFEKTYREPLGTTVDRSHLMWVVTVHAPVTDDGGPARPPRQHDVYSIVIDATTGTGVTDCMGCDWVKADQ